MKIYLWILLLLTICSSVFLLFTACSNKKETVPLSESNASIPTSEDKSQAAGEAQAPEVAADSYNYTLTVDGSGSYDISELLYGLFLEDINYAIDGGLYAELIKNRSFEFGSLAAGNEKCGWEAFGDISFDVIDGTKDKTWLNENNPKFARIKNSGETPAGIGNEGFLDGISIKQNEVYNLSVYLRSLEDYSGNLIIRLQDNAGNNYGEVSINSITGEWCKYQAQITATGTCSKNLKLYALIGQGTVDLDMVSLFPKDTYKGRENGVRKDIGQALEELKPKFLRFPGGCVVEGESLHNAYRWKDSIGNGMKFTVNGVDTYGDIAERPLAENLWGNQNSKSKNPYYMTYGIGFYEYFLLCEDLGAAPVPILNAGLSCLIQGTRRIGTPAESEEIGTPEFDQYIQDALDLVEFCKGDSDTKWGAIRIAMGHKEPFALTYIGIGNEQWGNEYFSRYDAFQAAFDQAANDNPKLYGNIKLIVANGPAATDTNAWKKIKLYGADYAGLVDEHYYMAPNWFLTNTHRYDSYDRSSTHVFVGEYAAKANNMEAALAEAAYMTGLERNGDIVTLASYAPLFGNSTSNQWTPDMLWFSNNSIWKSVNYYVQKLFSTNQCSKILNSTLIGTSTVTSKLSGKVGVGTWMTSASFDHIQVVNNDTGEILYSNEFETDSTDLLEEIAGSWSVKDGVLLQSHTGNPGNTITGDAAFLGDTSWTNYTLTLTATKLSGDEGFLIPIAVKDENNYYHWNIGGWGNTVSCLEQISGGAKSGQIAETTRNFSVTTGKAYELRIVVKENTIECYINGKGVVNYTIPKIAPLYQVSGLDSNGDMIVKLVNVSDTEQRVLLQTKHLGVLEGDAQVFVLSANSLSDMNQPQNPDLVAIRESTVKAGSSFIYNAPKYSVSILRIPAKK